MDGNKRFVSTTVSGGDDNKIQLEREETNLKPRTVELFRDSSLGFGFIAGSEKPVVVRFVSEKGPSESKLCAGDQILQINGENVESSPREYVIQLIRSCKGPVKLTVCQPPSEHAGSIKSAMLSGLRKAKLKSNPSRVRFAEGVVVNGSPLPLFGDSQQSLTSIPPNILRIFLENGQTKSFKFDENTKVQDVLVSLKSKLRIQRMQHFALVVEQMKGVRRNKLTVLNPENTIVQVASRPAVQNIRCLFRIVFMPRDVCDLAQQDFVVFEYLYTQCCNDVIKERYAPELKYETALRLAALQIHQHAISNNIPHNKVTIKSIEKEFGLDKFVPASLLESVKRKELRKLLSHLLKLNQTITGTTHKTLTSFQAKVYYLTIISELPSYGAKCFSTSIKDCNLETVILISPKVGISHIVGNEPVPMADIEELEGIKIEAHDQISSLVTLYLPSTLHREIVLLMEDRDAEEFILVLQGYYRLLIGHELYVESNEGRACLPNIVHQIPCTLQSSWNNEKKSLGSRTCSSDSSPQVFHLLNGSNYYGNRFDASPIKKSPLVREHSHDFCPMMMTDDNGYVMSKNSSQGNTSIDFQSFFPPEILRKIDKQQAIEKMQELVENSEQYLSHSHQQRESSDSDASHMSLADDSKNTITFIQSGSIKHSDSLLLINQQNLDRMDGLLFDAIDALRVNDFELESDTESVCIAPYRVNKNSADSELVTFKDGINSESDLIDLTVIPPPDPPHLKNEEEIFPPQIPPPMFADSFSEEMRTRGENLDEFFKAIPPPEPTPKLTQEQISSFIIPPPPQIEEVENKINNWNPQDEVKNMLLTTEGGKTLQNSKCKNPPQLPPRSDSLVRKKLKPFPGALDSIQKLQDEHQRVIFECDGAQAHGGGSDIDELKFQESIHQITVETRYLVNTSKALMRSMSLMNGNNAENEDVANNLKVCVEKLKTLTELSNRLVIHTASPRQTRNLLQKVLEVMESFKKCFASPETSITEHAENIANAIATLLRSLRIFSPYN